MHICCSKILISIIVLLTNETKLYEHKMILATGLIRDFFLIANPRAWRFMQKRLTLFRGEDQPQSLHIITLAAFRDI